jgi:tetratricopeptide (TPR) repeat protein
MTEKQVTGWVCAPGQGDSLQHDGVFFGLDSIRRALKALNDPQKLGNHPLAQLKRVRFRLRGEGYGDNVLGRGAALHDVLCEAIESLRPGDSELDFCSQSWRPYLILTRQYLEGHSPTCLAQQMYIGRSTYFQEQRRTLTLFAGALQQMEQRCTDPNLTVGDQRIPFMAPPCPVYYLVGRTDLLHDLKRRLFAKDRLVLSAVNGLPGVGKTALAIELAHDPEVLAHFEDGVLWAGLGRQPDVFALLGTWGVALGIQTLEMAKLTTIEERARSVHMAIGTRHMLLVIDDAWQAETALAFKLGGPNCAYLLTTRIPEVSLAFADGGVMSVPELGEDDSVALLGRLAPQAVEDEPGEVRRLARAVGGLPLALTLMGWYLRKETRSGHPRRLRRALECLNQAEVRLQITQPRALLERRPDVTADTLLSLQVVIGISDETLDETAQRALRALAVFSAKPNTFSEKAALAVADVPVETLDTLADRGLLESSGPGRYTLHQTIADYARLDRTDRAVYERMCTYFVHYVEVHKKDYVSLDLEINNIVTALQIASDQGTTKMVLGANALYEFLEARGLYKLAKRLLGKAERVARDSHNALDLATTLRNLGRLAMKQGDYAQAEVRLQEGIALAREVGHLEMLSALLFSLGAVADYRGDYAQAEAWYQEGLKLAREIGDLARVAWLLNNLGGVSIFQGNYERAEAFCREGLNIARTDEHEYRETIVALLTNLGLVAKKQGDYRRAQAFYQEGLALARKTGYRERVIGLLGNLGSMALEREDYVQADTFLQESIALAQEINHSWMLSGLLISRGELYLGQQCWEAASSDFHRGLEIARESGAQEWIGSALFGLAQVAAGQGNVAEARRCGKESLALFKAIGHCDADKVTVWSEQLEP